MFDTILRNSQGVEFKTAMILMAVALVLGIVLACVYMLTDKTAGKPFLTALVLLPVISCAVVTLVNGNLGAAIAVAGSFTLVRFRSKQGNAKELAVVFFALALGLASASGYIFYTCIFAALVLAVLVILSVTGFGSRAGKEKVLKVSMPDSVDYEEAFNAIFDKYTDDVRVESVKTANKETVFEVKYALLFKKDADTKAFLCEIGEINGHLPMTLTAESKKAGPSEL